MTLEEFTQNNGLTAWDFRGGEAKYIVAGEKQYPELYHLTDYVVSTYSNGVYWLRRKS